MKPGIHPKYEKARITCACGRVTETRSTVGEVHVEICSHCHPFFTGRQKLVDTAGRVERFMAKYGMEEGEEAREMAEAAAERASEGERQELPEEIREANLAAAKAAAAARAAREEAEEGAEEKAPAADATPDAEEAENVEA